MGSDALGPAEAVHRKFRDRRRGLRDTAEPGAARMEAGDMDRPASGIQPPYQLDHLTFGAARFEAGHDDGDGNG